MAAEKSTAKDSSQKDSSQKDSAQKEPKAPPGEASADKPASKSAGRLATVVAMLALIVALLALALAGWSGSQQLAMQDLPGRVGADAGKLDSIQQRLDRLAESLTQQRQFVTDINTSVDNGLSRIAETQSRLEQTEKLVAGISGVNPQSRANWLKTEALYYMRIANAQVLLAGNPEVAASALQFADDKLRDSGDPTLVPVRALLSDEIAALQAVPQVDRVGIALRLKSLAVQADAWPFRQTTPDSFAPEFASPDSELSPWDRFLATLQSVLDSIVTVKETDELAPAQLGSSEQSLIIESVKAELQVARLAFIGGNPELFTQSLEYAEQLITNYFDVNATPVSSALKTIAELRELERPGKLPDISASLAELLAASANSEAQ